MAELSGIHAYYRQCQTVMRNGEQCRCPAQKGSDTCRNHAGRSHRLEKRRAAQAEVLRAAAERITSRTGRKHRPEEVFRSRLGIQAALDEVGQAMIEGRLDEDGAAELLAELERAVLQIGHRESGALRSGTSRIGALRSGTPLRLPKSPKLPKVTIWAGSKGRQSWRKLRGQSCKEERISRDKRR